MRALILIPALFWTSIIGCPPQSAPAQGEALSGDQALRRAFEQRTSNFQVEGLGSVKRILTDDNKGSRHQRFILALGSGQTLLIAHNIDVAPRVSGLRKGDKVEFLGEYEWSPEGGVIHWTHRDPDGRHPGGWLKHKGKTYQ
jgi:hypothetical protein